MMVPQGWVVVEITRGWIRSKNLMHNLMTIVDNTVLC